MIASLLDLTGAAFIAVGALLCFAAAVSLVRFPDVLGKMHAITKPQVLGLIFVALGIALNLRTWWGSGLCLLIVVIQLLVNDLSEDLEEAGYSRPEDAPRTHWRT